MNDKIYKLLGAAALSFFSVAAQAQDIKLGFNGDLSASPSALSERPFLVCRPRLTTSTPPEVCSVKN